MGMIKVTNILTQKNSGFTPEPSNVVLRYIILNTGWPYCPEQLSKPVLRTQGNIRKSRNQKKLSGSFFYIQTAVYKIKTKQTKKTPRTAKPSTSSVIYN